MAVNQNASWECIQAIRGLIKRYGWRVFILSLAAYTGNVAKGLGALGLGQHAADWQKVSDKIKRLRKNLSNLVS